MVYKLGHFHSMANTLLQLLDATENAGVLDKTIDTSLFIFQPECLHEVHTYIYTENFPKGYSMK